MRARKEMKEAEGLVGAADKFDDVYQRMEALADHAHNLIKTAGDEKLVDDWWSGMQDALQKMQEVSGEIRQPTLPGLEEPTEESTEEPTDHAQVQEENTMNDIEEAIARLSKLAGLAEAGHKPDNDKDGIPDWADKNPDKKGGDEDRIEEAACTTCHADPCKCESVEEAAKNPYAIGMAAAKKSAGYGEKPAHDLPKSVVTKGHEIAKKVEKNESVEESVDLDECGMPMISGTMVPELTTHDMDNTVPDDKEMFHLNVRTPNKTMTFVTDDPEEIIRVLRASGVAVEETQTTTSSGEQYTPPSRMELPLQNELNKVADEAINSPYQGQTQVQMNKVADEEVDDANQSPTMAQRNQIEDESYENSAEDNAEDAEGEKRTGMSHDEWESSSEDNAEDIEEDEDDEDDEEEKANESLYRILTLSGIVNEGAMKVRSAGYEKVEVVQNGKVLKTFKDPRDAKMWIAKQGEKKTEKVDEAQKDIEAAMYARKFSKMADKEKDPAKAAEHRKKSDEFKKKINKESVTEAQKDIEAAMYARKFSKMADKEKDPVKAAELRAKSDKFKKKINKESVDEAKQPDIEAAMYARKFSKMADKETDPAKAAEYRAKSDEFKKKVRKESVDATVQEHINILRKLSGYAPVSEGKWGNSVSSPSGDPVVAGDTEEFAMKGTGKGKSGRGDKGLATVGDNPLGHNDRDLTESKMMADFAQFLKEHKAR